MSKERYHLRNAPALIKDKPAKDTTPDNYDAKRIKDEEDIARIQYPSEQEFARFLLKKNPHLTIIYEPQMFEYKAKGSQKKGTLPDFLIINPNNANEPIYVEITCAPKTYEGVDDHKGRQKDVMKNAAPEARYVVLYRENLSKMQRKNPDFNPFHKPPVAA